MRSSVRLFAASVLLCAVSYGQQQQSAGQEPQADAQQQQQPAPPPPPSLGEIARQLKLKKQQKEAQLLQAKAPAPPNVQASDATQPAEPQIGRAHV